MNRLLASLPIHLPAHRRGPRTWRRGYRWGLLLLALVVAGGLIEPVRGEAAPEATVEVVTDPSPEEIVPDETLVQVRLRVLDADGHPIPDARVALHLDAPPSPTLLRTDFPLVEGTSLLDLELDAPEGEIRFAAIYPIRGRYTLQSRVTLPDGRTIEAAPTLEVGENPVETRNFVALLVGLATFGFFSGIVLGRGQRVAGAWLLAGLLGGVPALVVAHDGEPVGTQAPVVVSETEGPLHARLTISPGHGAVGKLSSLEARLSDPDGRATAGEILLTAWHIEDDRPVYIFRLPAPEGYARLQAQFFDGTTHELRLEGTAADGRAVQLSTPLEVEAFAPPLSLKVQSLLLLLTVVAIGLVLGIWLGTRGGATGRPRRVDHEPFAP